MPARRLSMRKIREVLRLKHVCGLSNRQIAQSCHTCRRTVADYLNRAEVAGLSWPLPQPLDDTALERLLFPPLEIPASTQRPEPDWTYVHDQLKRHKHVKLELLWQEYKQHHPQGYQYTWFCKHYRAHRAKLDLVMRQEHKAGEKLFIDFSGMKVAVIDPATGKTRQAEIFVAVMGASNYTYAEAVWTQQLSDWIHAHVRCFEYLGGVPELVVPDNLKAGITHAHRYEPDVNPTYQDMAQHYDVAVLPARSRRPKDKAKVEVGVQIVQRWILARLRKRTFFSLAELNRAIRLLLEDLNARPFKKMDSNRKALFESLDKPRLSPLPQRAYSYAEWKKARVHIDYHVEVLGHYYSVPYKLVGKSVDVRIAEQTIECFIRSNRVAAHVRKLVRGGHTTQAGHMPTAHRHYAQWTPQRLIRWAEQTGEHTAEVIELILSRKAHAQQGFRSALGILRLAKTYSPERLEAACQKALSLDMCSYRSIASLLKSGLESRSLDSDINPITIQHSYIRGSQYYSNPSKTLGDNELC